MTTPDALLVYAVVLIVCTTVFSIIWGVLGFRVGCRYSAYRETDHIP